MAFSNGKPINWRTFAICVLISLGQLFSAYQSIIIGTTLGKPDFMQKVGIWTVKDKPTADASAKEGAVVGLFQVSQYVDQSQNLG